MRFVTTSLAAMAVLGASPSLAGAQGLVTQKNISFAMADAAAHAALAACECMGFKVSAAVVDRGRDHSDAAHRWGRSAHA